MAGVGVLGVDILPLPEASSQEFEVIEAQSIRDILVLADLCLIAAALAGSVQAKCLLIRQLPQPTC